MHKTRTKVCHDQFIRAASFLIPMIAWYSTPTAIFILVFVASKWLSFATKSKKKRRCLKPMKEEMDVEKFPTHHFFMSNHSYLTWNSRKLLPCLKEEEKRSFEKSQKDGAFSHGLGLKNGLTTKAKRKEAWHSQPAVFKSHLLCSMRAYFSN